MEILKNYLLTLSLCPREVGTSMEYSILRSTEEEYLCQPFDVDSKCSLGNFWKLGQFRQGSLHILKGMAGKRAGRHTNMAVAIGQKQQVTTGSFIVCFLGFVFFFLSSFVYLRNL